MIAIVDYGAGNLTSVLKAFRACGAEPRVVGSADDLAGVEAIVVPGVGHFAATASLDERWRAAIRGAVDRGTPLLGICLGMQWLYEGSDESPELAGLGIVAGRVARMTGDVKVPHVGWNTLEHASASASASPLLEGVEPDAAVYFTHSYAAPLSAACVAVTTHGAPFAAIVEAGNVAGMQFHPEKSGRAGLTLLSNWIPNAV